MLCLNILFVALFISVSCDPNNIIVPCTRYDEACVTRSAKLALPRIFEGVPSLGVQTSDPTNLEEVIGDLSTLKYRFTEGVVTGFKNCDINNIKLDLDKSKLRLNATCNNIVISGNYVISGHLVILPIEGKGPFTINCKQYQIAFDGDLKQIEGSDGKTHLIIKKYRVDAVPTIGITFDLQNLFNGQKDLAEAVIRFANENWREVADFVQPPVISAAIKKVIANTNKVLKAVPLEEMVL